MPSVKWSVPEKLSEKMDVDEGVAKNLVRLLGFV